MIALTRNRTEEAIHPNFRGVNRIEWNKELLQEERKIRQGISKKHTFTDSRWKVVKEQLWKETANKCAYCEAPAKVVSHGDVEHFRPKSIYWWLAYNYDNYLVSCAICNQVFKRDDFPVLGQKWKREEVTENTTDDEISELAHLINVNPLNTGGMSVEEFITSHKKEKPLLLNPYFDKPDEFYAWQNDDTLKRVFLVSAKEKYKPYIEAAETYYGLNRLELSEYRYIFYEMFEVYCQTVTNEKTPEELKIKAEKMIEKMKSNEAPFAGMIRYFDKVLRKKGNS